MVFCVHSSLRPVAAAVVKAILDRPELMDEQLETLDVQGLGDPALSEIAKEIICFRLTASRLDSDALQRHLASRGFEALLAEIARAAGQSGAPFLHPQLALEDVRGPWSHALGLLIEIAALERALDDAKAELERDPSTFWEVKEIKSARDAKKRDVGSGTLWSEPPYDHKATLH